MEPDLTVTPVLSSAKRKFRIWIFEPMDLILSSGWIIFGHYFTPFYIYFGVLAVIFTIIAFFKYGKPDGYLTHKISFGRRPKTAKPSGRQKTPRFFDPQIALIDESRRLTPEELAREAAQQLQWVQARVQNQK